MFSKDGFMKKTYNFSDKPDLWLLCSSVIAALFGIFVINSATASLGGHWRFVIVQSVAFILGLLAMYAVILFKYTLLEKFRYLVFGGGMGMLILVLLLGKISHGTQGWIELGPISIQPSEIAKICFIITISTHISQVKSSINKIKTLVFLGIHFLCYIIPVLLQPDFGTAMVFAFIFILELFFAGIDRRYILWAAGGLLVLLPIAWLFLADFQKGRILSFFNPESDPTGTGYHVLQSQLAIGSGKLFGRGYLNGPQTQFGYLPEKQTDFIFSVIGEEFGLLGTVFVTVILFIIVYRCFDNAQSLSHDAFGEHICIGVGAMFLFHIIENIGMCIGLMPITGIPLPFISYGGSNLVTCFIAAGLVQSIRMRRRAIKFNI